MPLAEFLRMIARESGVSVVAEENLDGRSVTVEFDAATVSQILGVVGRRLGVQVTRSGGVYYMGQLRPEDRGVLVRHVSRLTPEQASSLVGVLLSEHGRSVSLEGGVVAVADRVEVLTRVSELLELVSSAPADAWILQAYVVTISDRKENALGVDTSATGEIALSFATAGASDALVSGGLKAVLDARWNDESVKLEACPMVLVADGALGVVKNVREVPVPQRTVSSEGTVSINGYSTISAGLTMTVTVRESGSTSGLVDFALDMSEIVGYVEEAPIVQRDGVTLRTFVDAGGVYLVGQMSRSRESDKVEGVGRLGVESSAANEKTWVWLRAYKVGGPALTAAEP
jgi:hypothetical protein